MSSKIRVLLDANYSTSEFTGIIPGYEIVECSGESRWAYIYKARQLTLDRFVSIKIIKYKLTKSQNCVSRFLREVEILSKLQHPYILQAIDAGMLDNVYYIVTEYFPGIFLEQYIKGRGRLPELEALCITKKILEALGHIWQNNLQQRELNPKNIMICENIIKICDLSWANYLNLDTQTTLEIAPDSLLFMSPEQIRTEATDFKSDIYALGCILHTLLLAAPPYSTGILQNLWQAELPPIISIRNVRPDLHAETGQILEKMLQENPADRFESFAELEQQLAHVIHTISLKNENTSFSKQILYKAIFYGFIFMWGICLLWLYFLPPKTVPTPELTSDPMPVSFSNINTEVFQKCAPSVVLIKNQTEIGSGVVLPWKIILTNAHVVENNWTVNIILKDGLSFVGDVIHVNRDLDLALISIHEKSQYLTSCIVMENSPVKVGEDILIIGHPHGLYWSLSKGTVSGVRGDSIQTDAKIYPGNSGGPMLNTAGKMVGLTSFLVDPQNPIGFAISVPKIQEFLDRLGYQ